MTDPVSGFRLAVRDLAPYGAQLFMSDRWAFSTGSAMPGMEATKLAGDLLSDYWSSINHRASCSWIEATSDVATSTDRKLRVLGVLGLNRRSPTALLAGTSYTSNTARVRVDSYPLATRIRPSFTLSGKVNLTGSDANLTGHPIDVPDDPAPSGYSELKLAPSNTALPTGLTATFASWYASERALAGNGLFRVHLRDVNNPTHVPAITLVVDQVSGEGPSVFTVTYERVTASSSSGGFIASFAFAFADLNNGTEPIRVQVTCATACDFIGMELVLDHTGYLYDSGPIDLSAMSPGSMLALRPDLTLPAGVVYVHVELSDFYAYTTGSYVLSGGSVTARTATAITAPGDPDGRCHAGRFVGADALIFPISGTGGYNLQVLSSGEPSRTRSGSLRGGRANVEWVEVDLALIGLSRVLLQKIEQQLRALGLYRTPTLLVPDPGLTEGYTDEQTLPRWVVVGARAETHLGRMKGLDEDVDSDGQNHTRDRWDMTLHLVEHNATRSGGV